MFKPLKLIKHGLYYKLLNDYLNKDIQSLEYEILDFEERGSYLEVKYKMFSESWSEKKLISIFDLLTFVYSKVSV